MKRARPTPPWVIWAIQQIERDIIETMGRPMLPETGDVLGCGSFGCVMRTGDPAWVCKVTLDGSEAFFAQALSTFGGALEGICQYLHPVAVDSPAGRIWVLWRSSVEMPTLRDLTGLADGMPDYGEMRWESFDTMDKSSGSKDQQDIELKRIWAEIDELERQDKAARGLDVYPTLDAMTQAGLSIAGELFTWTRGGGTVAGFDEAITQAARAVLGRFEPRMGRLEEWRYGQADDDSRMIKTAFKLLGYGFHVGQLQTNVLVPELGDSLRRLYDGGILMADLNSDNIARLGGIWTLFDGGFCVPIQASWAPLWQRVGADPSPWYNQDRWEPFMVLKPNPVQFTVLPDLRVEGSARDLQRARRIATSQGLTARKDGRHLRVSGFPSGHDASQFARWLSSQGFTAYPHTTRTLPGPH